MATTIRTLLKFGGDRLRLVVPAEWAGTPSIDVPLTWLHGSDLRDPTPFLEPGQAILTDGSQFALEGESQASYDDYVVRLRDLGVVGIGFGSRLLHQRVPPGLEQACTQHGVVLFEMTDMTPYLAYIRFVADEVANARAVRTRWIAEAQRSLSKAALRPDGLSAILTELETLLEARAALFDSTGARISGTAGVAGDFDAEARIGDTVIGLLERGVHAVSHVGINGENYSVQTLAGELGLSGALVMSEPTTPHRDAPEVVESVIALATLALTQGRKLDLARRHLRAGVLEQLLSGNRALATRTAEVVWGRLPIEPSVVVMAVPPSHEMTLLDALERESGDAGGAVFFAQWRADRIVVIVEAPQVESVLTLLARHGAVTGASQISAAGTLSQRHAEAGHAVDQALVLGRSHVPFEDLLDRGMLGVLRGNDAASVARGILSPLHRYDTEHRAELVRSLSVWLHHDCAWKPSAAELGIHRHTLRQRIETAERIINLDLSRLGSRLELWAALSIEREERPPRIQAGD